MKYSGQFGVLMVALLASSCAKHVVPVAGFIPPAPRSLSLPLDIEEPPSLSSEVLDPPVWSASWFPVIPAPRPLPRPAKPVTPPKPETATLPESPAPSPPPVLVQLLSAAEQRSYNQQIDQALRRVEDNLSRVEGRQLNQDQRVTLGRIRAFIRQAADIRQSDLVTSRSLAQRADVLCQDLVRTLR